MKSTTLLCIALPAFIIGSALSLVVYARDVNTGNTRGLLPKQHDTGQLHRQNSKAQLTHNGNTSNEDITHSDQQADTNMAYSVSIPVFSNDKNKLEPAAIFLFGAGLAGLASFTRKRFKISSDHPPKFSSSLHRAEDRENLKKTTLIPSTGYSRDWLLPSIFSCDP